MIEKDISLKSIPCFGDLDEKWLEQSEQKARLKKPGKRRYATKNVWLKYWKKN